MDKSARYAFIACHVPAPVEALAVGTRQAMRVVVNRRRRSATAGSLLLLSLHWPRSDPLPVRPMPSMYMPVARFLMRTLSASVSTDHCWLVLLLSPYWLTAEPSEVRPAPSRYRPVARFLMRT